jgi:dTDP-D-glucose 4,6-dehydratase
VTNCSNNYGPFHFPEKLIPLVILNALEASRCLFMAKGIKSATGCLSKIMRVRCIRS